MLYYQHKCNACQTSSKTCLDVAQTTDKLLTSNQNYLVSKCPWSSSTTVAWCTKMLNDSVLVIQDMPALFFQKTACKLCQVKLSWGLSTALTKFTQLLVDLKHWLSKSAKCYLVTHSYCISVLLLPRTADIWKCNCMITSLIQVENGEKQIKNLFLSLFRLKLLNNQCHNAT